MLKSSFLSAGVFCLSFLVSDHDHDHSTRPPPRQHSIDRPGELELQDELDLHSAVWLALDGLVRCRIILLLIKGRVMIRHRQRPSKLRLLLRPPLQHHLPQRRPRPQHLSPLQQRHRRHRRPKLLLRLALAQPRLQARQRAARPRVLLNPLPAQLPRVTRPSRIKAHL